MSANQNRSCSQSDLFIFNTAVTSDKADLCLCVGQQSRCFLTNKQGGLTADSDWSTLTPSHWSRPPERNPGKRVKRGNKQTRQLRSRRSGGGGGVVVVRRGAAATASRPQSSFCGGKQVAMAAAARRSPDGWKRDIVRQLERRDRNQHAMFRDVIRLCTTRHASRAEPNRTSVGRSPFKLSYRKHRGFGAREAAAAGRFKRGSVPRGGQNRESRVQN